MPSTHSLRMNGDCSTSAHCYHINVVPMFVGTDLPSDSCTLRLPMGSLHLGRMSCSSLTGRCWFFAQGIALGGGCEAAMACNARLVTPGTKMGLPELSLGIIPGFGGTQRLPRLVGCQQAAQMMLTSKPIGDKAAKAAGLVDEIVPKDKCAALAPYPEVPAVVLAGATRPRQCLNSHLRPEPGCVKSALG